MFSLIKRLQSKPRNKRRIIAFSVSAGFTLLIFVFWFSGVYLYGDPSSENEVSEQKPSPFRVINRNIRGFLTTVGDSFSEIDEVMEQNGVFDLYENSENVNKEGGSLSGKEKEADENNEKDEEVYIDRDDPEKPPDEHPEFDEEEVEEDNQ